MGCGDYEFNEIHAICTRLLREPCKLCPAREDTKYGRMTVGCYALAEETANIAKHGNPWGPDAPPPHVRSWQQRFNDE